MGITGLLPYLKGAQRAVHISSFKGMKVAVDAYCWLHKGSYSCATQIVMKTAKVETLPFINYCLRRVNLLRQHGITPIMVFDGGYLPTKASTEQERREKRKAYLTKGKELLKQGKKSEAHECFQKSVDITPEMALVFIKECRKLGVECIVAPYEADAQLAYLSKQDIVDVVITEDSDLLVFGSKRVFYKMDESGNGQLLELKDLGKANKSLIGFTETSFRQMCIFSGCDYLPNVPGIGLGKSSKLMRKHNMNPSLVIRALRCESSKVPQDYEAGFKKAEYTFLYQLVFDPRSQKQVRLNEIPDGIDPREFEFAGVEHSPKKAIHMARGNINPITKEVIDSYSPSKPTPTPSSSSSSSSSWSCSVMGSANKHYPVAIQAKLPFASSAHSSKPFKPPSKCCVMSSTDQELEKDELMNIYSSSPVAGDSNHSSSAETSLTLSRYFPNDSNYCSDDSSLEMTPESDEQKSNTTHEFHSQDAESCDSGVSVKSPRSSGLSHSTASQQPGPSMARKKLFPSGNGKLNKFAFTGTKRQRTQGEEMTESLPVRTNPFSISKQLSVKPDGKTSSGLDRRKPLESYELNSESLPQSKPEDSSMSENQTSTEFHHTDESMEVMTSGSGDHTQCVNFTEDHQIDPVGTNQLFHPHKRSLTTPGVSITSDKFRFKKENSCKRVGLSRKYKAPRLSEPGSGENNQLSIYSFMRKPRMKP